MARYGTKAENTLLGLLLIIGIGIFLIVKFFETVGFVLPLIIGVSIVVVVVFLRHVGKRNRIKTLMSKYGDAQVVDRIMRGAVWTGATSDQLLESLGHPVDIDEKVLKTKRKSIWKYYPRGGNRFGLRINVENDIVVGWDEKL